MERAFGSHAVGADAVEHFFVGVGEEGVDAIHGEGGFEAGGSRSGSGGKGAEGLLVLFG